ncbi:DUF397 domain-containing protein [Actinomadura sp. KC216]|uniref:DUF397 domain-containing protein n=1 Tax=Actinomadura sp. KC216 TaxID=2530370 RepID=UPI001405194E|nr:DUF397 domain-containing protein [Actinomadura sp. KC216]
MVTFRKSSYSEGANGCVEVSVQDSHHMVRVSRDPQGGHLTIGRDVWAALVSQIKRGTYDL